MAIERQKMTVVGDLAHLRERINKEYAEVIGGVRVALDHAILCGEALIQARALVPEGEWMAWANDNLEMTYRTANTYMRLATYRQHFTEPMSIDRAVKLLREMVVPALPSGGNYGRYVKVTPEIAKEAWRIRQREKLSWAVIAERYGCEAQTLARHCDPELRREVQSRLETARKRRLAAKRALAAQERERAVRESKGPASTAYGLIRRALQLLDQATPKATNREEKRALTEAMGYLHRGEDAIVVALQAARTRAAS